MNETVEKSSQVYFYIILLTILLFFMKMTVLKYFNEILLCIVKYFAMIPLLTCS